MKIKYILATIILLLLLILRLSTYLHQQVPYKDGQQLDFKTRLNEEPEAKFNKQQFAVTVDDGERINIITGLKPTYQYGDILKIKGEISLKNYKERVLTNMENPDIQIDNNDQNFISSIATKIRRDSKKFYLENLSLTSAGLLNGIIFGGNQGMPYSFLQDLRSSGVVHVIAASGMNVTFVASAMIAILGSFLKRRIALTIAIIGIIFYAFLAGFEPSIVRASIMSVLAFSASLLGRQNLSLLALAITGYVMIFFNPSLVTDIGFQLSFLATLGILLIKPIIDSSAKSLGKIGSLISDDLGTTISAQIATLPILLSVFGSYGMLSILVNALVLWTVPVLMVLGSLALAFGTVFVPLGRLFLYLAVPVLYFFENTVRYFGNFGWTLTIPKVSPAVWIGYYLLLFAGIILIHQHRAKNKHKRENTS